MIEQSKIDSIVNDYIEFKKIWKMSASEYVKNFRGTRINGRFFGNDEIRIFSALSCCEKISKKERKIFDQLSDCEDEFGDY